ncbi:hypothetical protein FNV43_RR11740 [Rhamnella rubrinervis]|uniref:BHLH domain-containing protein n=1 Tax=Rhamnella rubrinervis TaxID=2594499 RepID=A0A8K0H6E3_9ROSA|nr:hypothetical protein FNV43_RR11740 [Rhamnella rubrinervis]
MESLGAFLDGADWDSIGKMFSTEELDFTPHFLGQCSLPLEQNEGLNLSPSSFFPTSESNISLDAGINESLFYSLGSFNNIHNISQEGSNTSSESSGVFGATPSQGINYYFNDSYQIPDISMDVCVMDETNIGSYMPAFADIIMGGETFCIHKDNGSPDSLVNLDDKKPSAIAPVCTGNELRLKRNYDVSAEDKTINTDSSMSQIPKKKSRVARDVQKSTKKNVGSKKSQKQASNGKEEESNDTGPDHGQSSSSYSSEDDNASQESNGGATSETKRSAAVNLNGKMRASRGSATDPQSLYARKRRERINERLRILQNLVPNGTKVDISTMLEEAVQYVKFLQLQIKLLSSDNLWMYAPIAYNGVDIGFTQKISPLL